jgi:hypothetical protein
VISARDLVWTAPALAFVIALLTTLALRDDEPAPAARGPAARVVAATIADPAPPRLGAVPALPQPLARPRRRRSEAAAAPAAVARAPIAPATPAPSPAPTAPPAPAPVATPRPTPAPTFDDSGSGPSFDDGGAP